MKTFPKPLFLAAAAVACLAACCFAQTANTEPLPPPVAKALAPAAPMNPIARTAWFEDARFGLFVHWGLYSALEGSWNGHTMPDTGLDPAPTRKDFWYAEWISQSFRIPTAQYHALAARFDPRGFDAEAWAQEIKRAGMKYVVITAKHHDGFAMWHSDADAFSLRATPCKRDLLGELAAACRKHDIRFGLYYSQWGDYDAPGGGRPEHSKERPSPAAFATYWRGKVLPQVHELIGRYHPDLLWFDSWGDVGKDITPALRDELASLIRREAPDCLVNSRICEANPGQVDFLSMGDNGYANKWPGKPWEAPATMQRSWGYHAKDWQWKSSGQMIQYLTKCSALGGNYLLNIGPKADGSIPAPAVRRLREIGGWMATNGASVQNTTHLGAAPWGWWTGSKDGTLCYAHVHHWPANGLLPLKTPGGKVPTAAALLEFNQPLELVQGKDGWSARIPRDAPDAWDTVVVLHMAP